jgi:dienelactone hydrolase
VAAPLAAFALLSAAAGDEIRGAAFVIQAAGMQGVLRTAAEWSTVDVVETDAAIPWRGGTLRGRIYRPAADRRPVDPAAIDAPPALLVPGVHAEGIDEPRLVQFARDIASMRRIVVTAEPPDLKAYTVTPRTTDMIEDAASWLSTSSGFAPDGRVGMMGISFAGGLSIVAASRASLADRVAYVLSFGGHGDLPRTLAFLCTGRLHDGSHRAPHDYGIAIVLLGVADRMVPAAQVQPLRSAILAFLHASHVDMWDKEQGQREFTRARAMAEALAEPARTLMQYVNDRNVARLGPLLLPHVQDLGRDDALSPDRSAPRCPVYLLHGTEDNVIPAEESVLLAEALRGRGVRVTQLATPLITHAEVDRSAAVRAMWDLVGFWADLLDEQ